MRWLWARLTLLLRRRIETGSAPGQPDQVEHLSLREAWALVGIHTRNWWWVERYGEMPCGCTRNPVTRRIVAYRYGCPTHWPVRRVVLSATRDGLRLSEGAEEYLRARGHAHPRLMPRDHPDLIAVVEDLGERAGQVDERTGARTQARIVEIPADVEWRLHHAPDFGPEWIEERHRRWQWSGEIPWGEWPRSIDD